MFPINQIQSARILSIQNSLHSTMFPINLDLSVWRDPGEYPLHSTMFPINPARSSRRRFSKATLYIPLCFLLISSRRPRLPISGTLHSTMFPINRFPQNSKGSWIRALHSTMFPINLLNRESIPRKYFLYIPLCFLLIGFHSNSPRSTFNFTFHYVSY